VVLDPDMGAGTVAIAARDHWWQFMGAELDLKYHGVAPRRVASDPGHFDQHASADRVGAGGAVDQVIVAPQARCPVREGFCCNNPGCSCSMNATSG
jgi:hypothetical protein